MNATKERDQISDAGAGLRGDKLRQIVARASTPFERLDTRVFVPCPDADEQLVQARLEAWRQAAAKGDAAQFGRVLAWEGLSLEDARRAVTPASLRDDASLPAWAVLLGEVMGDVASAGLPALDAPDAAPHRFLDREKPLPFEELLTPFVAWAQRELRRRAGASYHRLTDQAQTAPERALLGQLIDTAAQPLLLAFADWKAGRQSSFARLLARTQDVPERDLYRGFIQAMLAGQQVPFFVEYAALARLLATMTTLWVEAQHEFLQRLDADWPALEQTFGGAALGQVTALRPFLSDPHRGRRAVMILQIEPDIAIVYKPKHLGTEVAYNRLLTWLTERGSPLPLKALRVIDRGSHGWVECVESLPCDDTPALARHYQRVGMLLCLVYVLDAIDCHYENLIAAGEHPILIDAETLMQPRVVMEQVGFAQTAQGQAVLQLSNSVMRTALLALWHTDAAMGTAHDFSGLGSHMQEERRYQGLQWSGINTDQMALTLQEMTIPAPVHHVPTVQGETVCLADWVEAVAAGFEQMYRFVLQQRDALLAQGSPLWHLAGQPIRFVFRPTDTYTRLLWQLREAAYLRDGVERSLGLEVLKRAAAGAEEKPTFWPLIRAERQQMAQLDVPFFTLDADADEFEIAPDDHITGLFESSGFAAVLERIKALGEADLALQVQLIQGCLYLRTMPAPATALAGPPDMQAATAAGPRGTQSPDADSVDQPAGGGHGDGVLDDAALLAEVRTIARRLRGRAIQAPDDTVTWLAPHLDVRQERFQFQPMGGGLYDGRLGVALFLAALARVSGEDEWRALCLSALRDDRRALAEPGWERVAPHDVGLAGGLGGAVYGLTRIGTLLDDATFVADALRAARLLTPEVIGGDTVMDVIGGTTGALLGLLALYDVVHDAEVLASATACGRHLLTRSVSTEAGRAWPTLAGRLLTGFSHGAAGIAYALLRLARVTGSAAFATAAAEAITYEDSTFLPEAGNWPDFRDFSRLRADADGSEPRPLMSSWCHGASGIGLGRLGGLDVLDNAAIQQDVQVALGTTRRYLAHRRGAVDHLCCGAMGQIETLLHGAQRLGQPELAAEARAYASDVVQGARQRGYALEIALPASVYVPGLFRGEAGIGYTLLRLIDPDRLPLILLCA